MYTTAISALESAFRGNTRKMHIIQKHSAAKSEVEVEVEAQKNAVKCIVAHFTAEYFTAVRCVVAPPRWVGG